MIRVDPGWSRARGHVDTLIWDTDIDGTARVNPGFCNVTIYIYILYYMVITVDSQNWSTWFTLIDSEKSAGSRRWFLNSENDSRPRDSHPRIPTRLLVTSHDHHISPKVPSISLSIEWTSFREVHGRRRGGTPFITDRKWHEHEMNRSETWRKQHMCTQTTHTITSTTRISSGRDDIQSRWPKRAASNPSAPQVMMMMISLLWKITIFSG